MFLCSAKWSNTILPFAKKKRTIKTKQMSGSERKMRSYQAPLKSSNKANNYNAA